MSPLPCFYHWERLLNNQGGDHSSTGLDVSSAERFSIFGFGTLTRSVSKGDDRRF